MKELGKKAIVDVYNDHKKILSGRREGEILDKKDWLIGCPVFKDKETGQMLGVGYECKIIELLDKLLRRG